MVAPAALRVVRCGGGTIHGVRAVFSSDSKYLLCASGDFVKMYSVATEETLRLMGGHADLVTGIQLNPHNHMQLYSSSLDGSIKLWDFMDGIPIKTFSVGSKLLALYALASSEDSVFVIVPKSGERDAFQLVSVKLTKTAGQDVEAKELSVVLDGVDASPKHIAFGREGQYVASVKEANLQVYFFKQKQLNRFSVNTAKTKNRNSQFTCIACHPTEDCIATGHADGKIRLWRNFYHKKDYTFSTLHWHHDIVMDLAYSVEGTSLLSGGVESVLVLWHNESDCRKDFLPRLGSPIEYISVSSDGSLCCTLHKDNRITIINSNLRFSKSIQGLIKSIDVKTGLVVDPRTKALVLNGEPGHLQFYSLQSDQQLFSLDIVQRQYIHQAGLKQADLVKVAFSARGKWLATVEEREEAADPELQLKLWFYDEETQSFKLNTRVNTPHENHITDMCFRDMDELEDDSPILVTTGRDRVFKVWVMVEDTDPEAQQSVSWSCDFVGSYHNYQATNCCFSEDGSLLAVSFEEIVTVWDSVTWELKCTFCHPPGKIRNICFGRLTCSKYLIGATDHGFLCCWNLLTCALEWSAHLNVLVLQPDPLSEHIAAVSWLSKESSLFVFKPNEPRPVYIQRNLCKEKILLAAFVPRDEPEMTGSEKYLWLRSSQLFFLTDAQELLTLSTRSLEERLTPSSKQLATEESLPVTPFSLLLGKHRRQQSQEDTDLGKLVVHNKHEQDSPAVKELLHTPAHVLPSASFLCPIFINSLLISKENKSAEEVADEVEMESEKTDDDLDEEGDVTEMEQEDTNPMELLGEMTCKLSKSQERELRKLRKMDYSWISAF
ncbi:WD repeat-containing protein 75 isoform X1 [Melopsittacus undulatus]|uniref:WD repeat-containing protein 75 isoform X1 n=1 Tax=Melopsittacus undulatus TaxID=13146 RepID=UPI00146A3A76|nr:WD repeat-containing protein 75 isoform X1 [Melopsittacus undulatus]